MIHDDVELQLERHQVWMLEATVLSKCHELQRLADLGKCERTRAGAKLLYEDYKLVLEKLRAASDAA